MMEQKTLLALDEFLQMNYVEKGTPEYFEKINLDETMRRVHLQTRLRQQRTMAISDFEIGKRTFIHLIKDTFLLNEKTVSSFMNKIGMNQDEQIKALNDTNYHPSFNQLMKMFLILEFTELEAKQWSEELGYTFAAWEHRDLIVLFCLRNHIHKMEEVNKLMLHFNLPTW